MYYDPDDSFCEICDEVNVSGDDECPDCYLEVCDECWNDHIYEHDEFDAFIAGRAK